MFSLRLKRLLHSLAVLSLALACSRSEPQGVAVNTSESTAPQQGGGASGATPATPGVAANPAADPAAASPTAPSGTAPQVTPDTPEEGLPGFDQAIQKLNGTTAEVTVDGKSWDADQIKVTGTDMLTGFEVVLESGDGEKLTIQVLRFASEGERVTGSNLQVAYARGGGTWLMHGKETTATVTRWRDDGRHPTVSLDCTAVLRPERGPRKTMRIEARVANVFVMVHPNTPEYGLEKKRGN